jgi:FkbM family methyltransferase
MSAIAGFIRRTPTLKRAIKPLYHLFVPQTRSQKLNVIYDELTGKIISNVVKDGDSCVDVGCHLGEIMDLILKASPTGRHFGFEPIPSLAAYLRRKMATRPTVEIFQLALAAEPGTTTFYHNLDSPAFSGLRSRKGAEVPIDVTIDTLDNVLAGARVSLIKIDVEGAELDVLKGAKNTLAISKPVLVFEFGIGGADFYGTTAQSLHEFLTSVDYKIYPLDESVTEPVTLNKLETYFESNEQYYFCAVPAGSPRPY